MQAEYAQEEVKWDIHKYNTQPAQPTDYEYEYDETDDEKDNYNEEE